MNCPDCGTKTKILETRGSELGDRRRHECSRCNQRFTTIEQIVKDSSNDPGHTGGPTIRSIVATRNALAAAEKRSHKLDEIVLMLEALR